MNKQKIVVIGNGMVGHHFVEQMMGDDRFALAVLGAEPRPAYDRVHLSSVFGGSTAADLALIQREDYERAGVEAIFGEAVIAIDREKKSVITQLGRVFSYDKLVLATGSYPFVPPVPGHDHKRCFVYRTIDDLGNIRAAAQQSKVGVVVGGGLLGLEAANALRNLGLETHVVEFAPQLMGVQIDADGGAILRRKIESLGIHVHTGKNTQKIIDGRERAVAMHFADSAVLETDLIVFSAGVRPDDKLARSADLRLGERGGIVIDYHCKTSDSDIYAIGECALWAGKIFGLVAPGYQMAKVAADALKGGELIFNGSDMSTKLKLLGVDVGSIGDAHAKTPGSKSYRIVDEHNGIYKKVVVNEGNNRVLGAVLVGDNGDYDTLLQYMLNDIAISGSPLALIAPISEDKPVLGAAALPMTATVCSCHNVSKQMICDSISSGCCSVVDVKSVTKASTGCGGCAALLKNVVETELTARGVSFNKNICEHFEYTRQELYHLIRIGKIASFEELVHKHGSSTSVPNLGCDICKPAVASILASTRNDYILEEKHRGLQDSNDHFLANIQKDGTYSIVPRVAGGEITPDKLIVIGQVAKKYDLYTKITGGQRIDMFGARSEQLPLIWKELIDAGFESGHAYGKALRTVKSCVGSTWCRYGVQDSVGMAIRIENRYKGLRAPHKLKMAVSGCTRECAEAQSKDVGVIATEKGWNLYMCGNGGMKPRHADLFATDLNDETLIRYIDRFFMFYIRTADRLQRTSVWMDNLEGGMDYLREVIIDDKLGIGAELESEMAHIIGTYQCEWKITVEDPEKVKRFSHFVNSSDVDRNVIFVKERGQIRPANIEERIEYQSRQDKKVIAMAG